jgi:hypothetical protein
MVCPGVGRGAIPRVKDIREATIWAELRFGRWGKVPSALNRNSTGWWQGDSRPCQSLQPSVRDQLCWRQPSTNTLTCHGTGSHRSAHFSGAPSKSPPAIRWRPYCVVSRSRPFDRPQIAGLEAQRLWRCCTGYGSRRRARPILRIALSLEPLTRVGHGPAAYVAPPRRRARVQTPGPSFDQHTLSGNRHKPTHNED